MFHLLSEYAKLLKYKPTRPPDAIELCSEISGVPGWRNQEGVHDGIHGEGTARVTAVLYASSVQFSTARTVSEEESAVHKASVNVGAKGFTKQE